MSGRTKPAATSLAKVVVGSVTDDIAKKKSLANYLKDANSLKDAEKKQIPILQKPLQEAPVPKIKSSPEELESLKKFYGSIQHDHGYGDKRYITAFFPYFVPYMVNPPQPCPSGGVTSLKITVDIGLHSYLIVRKESDITENGTVVGFNLYLDECALPANVNVITGNTMNAALLEENTLNLKHYLLTGPFLETGQIIAYLNELQPTIARELKERIAASILRARATGKLVNQAFPSWAREYEGAIEEIDRLLRCHIMHISSKPNYHSLGNATLHNRFCSIDHDDWNFRVKHHEVLAKQPPEGCSKLAAAEAPNLAFTIIVRVDLCHEGVNYVFSLRLDRGLFQATFPTASCIFKYSEMIEAFQSPAFRDYLLKLVHDAIASATPAAADFLDKVKAIYNIHAHDFFSLFASQLPSLWSSATFQIIETGCASIAKCIDQTDGRVKTLRLKCYDALTHKDRLCGGIYLIGIPSTNPNFNSLFPFLGNISQMRFCLRFRDNHAAWRQTINTFNSGEGDDIIRVRSGQICPSMSSSSGDTGTSQDTLTTTESIKKLLVDDTSNIIDHKQESVFMQNSEIIKQDINQIFKGVEELKQEATSLNSSTTLYKDGPEEPGRTIKQEVVNPGIFSKISSGISVLTSAVTSLIGLWGYRTSAGGASSRNLVTKTKRTPVRSRRVGGGGGKSLSRRRRGGAGGGGGSKTRRRSLRRSNKKLK